jgi:LuxR family quorum sensing-dependent transcriptional regulator
VIDSLATVFGTIMLKHWELQDDNPTTDYGVISERQAQCLYWASRGKTDWEIGAILSCRPAPSTTTSRPPRSAWASSSARKR